MKRVWFLPVQFVIQVAAGAAVVAYCLATTHGLTIIQLFLALMLACGGVVEFALTIIIVRDDSKAELGAGTMFITAAAILLPAQVATLAWAVGIPIGFALRRELKPVRLMNTGGGILACFLALSLAHLIGPPGMTLSSLMGAVVAALVFDPISLLFVAINRWLSGSVTFWTFVRGCIASELTAWPFLVCTGILLGALGTGYPLALPLAVAPLSLIFLASRARVAASEDRTRLNGLLRVTTDILEATTISAVTETVTAAASAIFESTGSRIDTEPGVEGELSAPFVSEHLGRLNLVVARRANLMYPYDEQDERVLETLASVTASALSKAAQHESATIQAKRDPLTNLANRRLFEEQVQSALVGMRSSDNIGVIFADLDRFKQINDEHGHKIGDEMLIETAARLSSAVRDGDLVARLGGDEFTVLLRGTSGRDSAEVVAERVLAAMRLPFLLSNGIEFRTTSSVGVALASEIQATSADVLIRAADAAMYAAKRAGKDCYRVADTQSETASSSISG